MWPGVPMRSLPMPGRLSTWCAAPRFGLISIDARATRSPPRKQEPEENRHEPGHPRALLRRAWPPELLAGLGTAGAGDVGIAPAEIQAGGVALRRGARGAGAGRRVR